MAEAVPAGPQPPRSGTGTFSLAGRVSVREAVDSDWPGIWALMEPIVRAGETYCWDRQMDSGGARELWFEPAPTCVYVAVDGDPDGEGDRILGTAQLHPNRGGGGSHVANASFMTAQAASGRGIARALAAHVLAEAAAQGYLAMQFNAVVETNVRAVALWQSLGFRILATVPRAFEHPVQGLTGLHIMHKDLAEGTQ
ncbi:GNAT family N-acetyltransferase [Arthrobacter caoxuetaonis]|uniref:GNAT family N-acetyltransferase n=1 Tax=Arthrobacter caoxuetaonis TaxID=2886935 RepID=A0A9X1MBC4_9MICC|nr:GNAT family N-acetyltransferase [Arthrobacter caoxuetaonis]MCC3296601.1 GNAT family N-acetyltransferase [Arthrobacter caoxuetaonis]USQ56571.1 GNAT family N-acetyltransferase [Arthrobacter caoxuetaonis]